MLVSYVAIEGRKLRPGGILTIHYSYILVYYSNIYDKFVEYVGKILQKFEDPLKMTRWVCREDGKKYSEKESNLPGRWEEMFMKRRAVCREDGKK
ncbi:hypothetical protein EGI32_06330 [Ferruginibacter sp. HRS2-29]|nr:hypothetical protein [Ferruginibacter sp. HRS2-29]